MSLVFDFFMDEYSSPYNINSTDGQRAASGLLFSQPIILTSSEDKRKPASPHVLPHYLTKDNKTAFVIYRTGIVKGAQAGAAKG
jgi:hypothetical protein